MQLTSAGVLDHIGIFAGLVNRSQRSLASIANLASRTTSFEVVEIPFFSEEEEEEAAAAGVGFGAEVEGVGVEAVVVEVFGVEAPEPPEGLA